MDIVIVGPGAVGCLLGSLLRLKGHGVTLLGRGAAVVGSGRDIRVRLPTGWLVASGFAAAVPPAPGLVMVALGRRHLAALRKGGLPLPDGTAHALFWNCDPREPERLGLAEGTWSLGLTLCTAVKLQEGDVELHGAGVVHHGAGAVHHGAGAVLVVEKRCPAKALLRDLAGFGLRVHAVEAVAPYHDALLVARLLELPAALCGTTIGHFLSHPEGRQLAVAVLGEGIEAMGRAGRQVARLPVGDPRQLLWRLHRQPREFDRLRDAPDRAYPSVLQAYLRSRSTEARELNRRIVELASAAGLSLTWNWRLFQKAGRPASLGFFRDPAELAAAVR